jgi:hypothetical protein
MDYSLLLLIETIIKPKTIIDSIKYDSEKRMDNLISINSSMQLDEEAVTIDTSESNVALKDSLKFF